MLCHILTYGFIKCLVLDDTITSIVTDDLNSNSTSVMGVAGGGGQLLLYLHLRDRDSNE